MTNIVVLLRPEVANRVAKLCEESGLEQQSSRYVNVKKGQLSGLPDNCPEDASCGSFIATKFAGPDAKKVVTDAVRETNGGAMAYDGANVIVCFAGIIPQTDQATQDLCCRFYPRYKSGW